MKHFTSGLVVGVLGTVAAGLGALFTFKKSVVDPIEDQEQKFEDNRKRALRKSRAAHNG
ncbi:MAG: DUF3042 family protein [Lentilactobacillus diolivorans]|jgi:hypothetical protein|uniref:DUF3042 domain-containing protein n=2 Tax=Lentilactobacillus diolivorans TaxID=179838 RepID=A0A0R1SFR8_9LACO|nr:DUF3042 family protein [Lentilactobacillus diolivorans]RRG04744.1 MAG: DUF3042 family protein [Lactobacillus sp.]KRL64616.1 hypothetical protein FC85_GL001130 [Lentilactobacillus diolivorans DSM 14421]MCH4164636.1 DUF3042 family protein [Lentilactobacillus diolivorans]MDH5104310.1 DUF3042 family protein [Lentilactobacillus diolivorans]GEP22815.1 DUF3042 domain-containing protein [Lentilactobacillus diolivorans]